MSDREAYEAVEVANAIEDACRGHSTVSVLAALGMVIGRFASLGQRPDLHGLLDLLGKQAQDTFKREMEKSV